MVDARLTRGKQKRGTETQAALLRAAGRVFSRMDYEQAKLRNISEEAGISPGSLYFHFGNKDDVAAAVLDAQQEKMTGVLSEAIAVGGTPLEQLLTLLNGMANLIATDDLVQAGIRLVKSLPGELRDHGHESYDEWQTVTESLISAGQKDGTVSKDTTATELAEIVNELFVGAQVLAGQSDNWQSLPDRIRRAQPHLTALLSVELQLHVRRS